MKKSFYKFVVIVAIVAVLVLGWLGFSGDTILAKLANSFGLFVGAWPDAPKELKSEFNYIYIAEIISFGLIVGGVVYLFVLNRVKEYRADSVQNDEYSLIVGLGEQNSAFLNCFNNPKYVLIVEKDRNNPNINVFEDRGFAIVISDVFEAIKDLRLGNLKQAVISTGNDRKNIAIATTLMNAKRDIHTKLFTRVDNRDLNILFKQKVIKSRGKNDIITFSLYENMVKDLFEKHSIFGDYDDILHSNKDFCSVIVGESVLGLELVYYLAMLSCLPNENRYTIYLVSPNASRFLQEIKTKYTKIDDIPHLKIEAINLDYNNLEFFTHNIWHTQNLSSIYIATDDQEVNIDIAIKLQDVTYLKDIATKSFKSHVFTAIYNNIGIGEELSKNSEMFNNFYSFADIANASSYENLVDEKLDLIAKLIHNDYTGSDIVDENKLNEKWLKLDTHKKESNKAQALHIDIKLKYLNLKRVPSEKKLSELLKINNEIYEKHLNCPLTIEDINRYTKDDFPKKFDTTIDKLALCEHNRWNAFHYLNGWSYSKDRDDSQKLHNCLIEFKKFDDEAKETYKYDLLSNYNLPNFLAHAGYEIVSE